MSRSEVFLTVNEFERPHGKYFTDRNGCWFVSDDLLVANYISIDTNVSISLSRTLLDPETDIVNNIGFFDDESRVFLFVWLDAEPVIFIGNSEKWQSVSTEHLYFHMNVIDVFRVRLGRFCVVSKKGYSIHDSSLSCLYEYRWTISRCCHDHDMLAFGDIDYITLHQMLENDTSQTIFTSTDGLIGFPSHILVYEDSIVFVEVKDGVMHARIGRYDVDNNTMLPFGSIERVLGRVSHVSLFDTKSMVVSTKEQTLLVDIAADPVLVIGSLSMENAVFINGGFVFNDSICRIVVENFEALCDIENDKVMFCMALMRRKNGLNTAMSLLFDILKGANTAKEMEDVIRKLTPCVTTPEAQIRFVRAVQFCKQTNAHLILHALVTLWNTGDACLVRQARLSLIEVMCQDECKHLINSLLLAWKGKVDLDGFCIRELMKRLSSDIRIDPRAVKDTTDLACACIEFGRQSEAKNILTKCIMDNNQEPGRVAYALDEYVRVFGTPEKSQFVEVACALKQRLG